MLYSAARPKIKTGDCLSFRSRELFGRLVARATGAGAPPDELDFVPSHVGFAVWPAWGHPQRRRLCVLAAERDAGRVSLQPLSLLASRYLEHGGRIWWQALDESLDGLHLVGHAFEDLGQPYPDSGEMLAVVSPWLRFWLRLFGQEAGYRTIHCAALMTRALNAAGCETPKPSHLTWPINVVRFPYFGERVELDFDFAADGSNSIS